MIKLSIIIPAYNEALRLPSTLESISTHLSSVSYESEVLLVLNNSTDNTREIAEGWLGKIKNFSIIDIQTPGHIGNAKGYAIRDGFNRAKGEYHMFMDADNATELSQVETFWSHFQEEGYSVVIGSRYIPGSNVLTPQSLLRRALSRVGNVLIQILVLPGIRDTQCGFKVFTRAVSQAIVARATVYGWGADIEMLVIAKHSGAKIFEAPVVWQDKARSMIRASSFWETLKELIRIWRRY